MEMVTENDEKVVKNCYQGIFVTETVLGNPNGDFVNNEPRNINGRVFTTDKCIKYNVRNYIHQEYETVKEENGKIKDVKDFVFFYPRLTDNAAKYQASYLTKDSVFEKYFIKVFEESQECRELMKDVKDDKKINTRAFEILLDKCPDCRMFGGTFSFQEDNKQIYGPIQLSYGLDIIGADIINLKIGTPFSSKNGQQKTTGEEYVVDHAVIAYDITVNPHHAPSLLKEQDLEMFNEGLVYGTNLRRSTSKKTEAKALILIKFKEGISVNLGELKHLIDVKSKKITDPKELATKKLILDMKRIKQKLDKFSDQIENIDVYCDKDTVKIEDFNVVGEDTESKDLSELITN